MKCEVCDTWEAVCEIRGFKVCADNFCKYDAWTFDQPDMRMDEMRGQRGGVDNSGTKDADPRPHEREKL